MISVGVIQLFDCCVVVVLCCHFYSFYGGPDFFLLELLFSDQFNLYGHYMKVSRGGGGGGLSYFFIRRLGPSISHQLLTKINIRNNEAYPIKYLKF